MPAYYPNALVVDTVADLLALDENTVGFPRLPSTNDPGSDPDIRFVRETRLTYYYDPAAVSGGLTPVDNTGRWFAYEPPIIADFEQFRPIISRASTTTLTITGNGPWVVFDEDGNALRITAPTLTKSTSTWAAGNNNGLMQNTIGGSNYVRIFLIYDPVNEVADYRGVAGNSTPTLPTGYTHYRKIGTWLTNASSQWRLGHQSGRRFLLSDEIEELRVSTIPNTNTNLTTSLPPNCLGVFRLGLRGGANNVRVMAFSSDANPSTTVPEDAIVATALASVTASNTVEIWVNNSRQIVYRRDNQDTAGGFAIFSRGYEVRNI